MSCFSSSELSNILMNRVKAQSDRLASSSVFRVKHSRYILYTADRGYTPIVLPMKPRIWCIEIVSTVFATDLPEHLVGGGINSNESMQMSNGDDNDSACRFAGCVVVVGVDVSWRSCLAQPEIALFWMKMLNHAEVEA